MIFKLKKKSIFLTKKILESLYLIIFLLFGHVWSGFFKLRIYNFSLIYFCINCVFNDDLVITY